MCCRALNFLLIPTMVVIVCGVLVGCNQFTQPETRGPGEWRGLGAAVTLPEGKWEVEQLPKKKAVAFHRRDDRGTIVLICAKPQRGCFGNQPTWLTLQNLFIEFRDKYPLGQWERKTAEGRAIHCTAFIVTVDERNVHVTACAVQHDFVTFEIVAWGFGEGPTPSRRIAEAVAETIQFPDAQRKK